jgi:hypothetical protein
LVEQAKALRLELMKKQNQQCSVLEVKVRRVQTQRGFQSVQRAIKNKEKMLDQRLAQYIDSTKSRQARELEEFTKRWQSEPLQRRYNRTSSEYRHLKRQEKKCAQLRRVSDAEAVHREVLRRQKAEVDDHYRAMVRDYNESKQRIEEKHGAELSRVSDVAKRKKEEFGFIANRALKPWAARMKKLEVEEENRKDPERLWNRQRRFEMALEDSLSVRSARPITGRAGIVARQGGRLPPLIGSPRY